LNLLNGLNRGFLAAQWSHKTSRLALSRSIISRNRLLAEAM
jgi:hypothetical protein